MLAAPELSYKNDGSPQPPSEKAVVEVFALSPQYLLVHGFLVANLRLGFAKLNVCCGQVGVLRFIEFVSVFKLFFENCQIWPAHLQC